MESQSKCVVLIGKPSYYQSGILIVLQQIDNLCVHLVETLENVEEYLDEIKPDLILIIPTKLDPACLRRIHDKHFKNHPSKVLMFFDRYLDENRLAPIYGYEEITAETSEQLKNQIIDKLENLITSSIRNNK